MIWFGSIHSTTISWNTVIFTREIKYLCELFLARMAANKFSLCFVCTYQWGSGQQCMEVRKAIILDWNVTRMKRKLIMTMFWEMTIESKLLNQFKWSWYHYVQQTTIYLMIPHFWDTRYTGCPRKNATLAINNAFIKNEGQNEKKSCVHYCV